MLLPAQSKQLGDRLFYVRKVRNLELEDVAKMTGVSRYRLERYEMNLNEPGFDALVALALCLDTSVDYLCGHRASPVGLTVKEPQEGFPARLRAARKKSGLARAELAERLGISPRCIAPMETTGRPSPRTLRALSLALGASIDYLCGLTEEKL